MCIPQSWRWGRELHPRLSCYIGFSVFMTSQSETRCSDHLHKWVIDGDDKDFAGILKLVATDVARDMSGRARRA